MASDNALELRNLSELECVNGSVTVGRVSVSGSVDMSFRPLLRPCGVRRAKASNDSFPGVLIVG